MTSFEDWNNGGDFVVNTFIGGSIFIVQRKWSEGTPSTAVFFSTSHDFGTTEALINLQFRDVNQESFYASGMTLTFPIAGVLQRSVGVQL